MDDGIGMTMMIKDHGTFSLYKPDRLKDDAKLCARIDAGGLFVRSNGLDWYTIADVGPTGNTFAMVKDGRVISASVDPSTLWPIDCTLIETDQRCEVGYVYDGSTLAPYVEPLDAMKTRLAARIDADAEKVRQRFLTPGDGMQFVYREKFEQAQAVQQMGEAAANALPSETAEKQFPTLCAGLGYDAPTLWGCAEIVLDKFAEFSALTLTIERVRLSAKAAIRAAGDHVSVRAAYEAAAWPT